MAPLVAAILKSIAVSAASSAASKAMNGNQSSTQIGEAPQMQPFDLSQLLAQAQQPHERKKLEMMDFNQFTNN